MKVPSRNDVEVTIKTLESSEREAKQMREYYDSARAATRSILLVEIMLGFAGGMMLIALALYVLKAVKP